MPYYSVRTRKQNFVERQFILLNYLLFPFSHEYAYTRVQNNRRCCKLYGYIPTVVGCAYVISPRYWIFETSAAWQISSFSAFTKHHKNRRISKNVHYIPFAPTGSKRLQKVFSIFLWCSCGSRIHCYIQIVAISNKQKHFFLN